MPEDYLELFVRLISDAHAASVAEWATQHNLIAMRMKAGILIAGTKDQLEGAFSTSFSSLAPSSTIPIPQELQNSVSLISVLGPRSYHTGA
jgi:hypothetical protein